MAQGMARRSTAPTSDGSPTVVSSSKCFTSTAPTGSVHAASGANGIGSSVDASSRALNPPRYPPTEARQGVGGTVVLVISIDAQGNVLDVSVEKSSRNRNLDRAAMDAARKWRFNPEVRDGVAVASRVRVPVDFVPPR